MNLHREGKDVCLWAIGSMVQSALQAADKRAIIARKGYLMDCFITCLVLRV